MQLVGLLLWWFVLVPQPERYPQLPSELACKLCHEQAVLDTRQIRAALEALCGEPCYEDGIAYYVGGGYRADRLRELLAESQRVELHWMAAWWLRWPTATAEQLEEYEEQLRALVGDDAFYRGQLPLPLSLR